MQYPYQIEDKIQPFGFVSFIFEVVDLETQMPSRITISSTAFLIGGVMHSEDARAHGETIAFEEGVALIAMEIIDSIEEEFTVLNTYHQ